MKKLDKLILSSFIGPFILTFLVVVFILLTQHMLKYFDDIIGKDIGVVVLANLMFDFSIFMAPIAFPLAVLLSSLMTFGNLGEHFELTAIKSAGISLLRAIVPIFIFVIGLTVFAFYFNNYFVPKAALNAYSLLYDIKQKKPALDLKEGAFYNGIPDLSIKVNKKDPESGKIWDVIIYDHRDKNGNKKVTLADSGRMHTVFNDQYLVLELYNGHSYIEGQSNAKAVSSSRNTRSRAESLSRIQFDKSKIVLDLSSFDMKHTKKELFSGNRIMRNLSELGDDMDSLRQDVLEDKLTTFKAVKRNLKYLSQERLSLPTELVNLENLKDSLSQIKLDSRKGEFVDNDSMLVAMSYERNHLKEKKKKTPVKKTLVKKTLSNTSTKNSIVNNSALTKIDSNNYIIEKNKKKRKDQEKTTLSISPKILKNLKINKNKPNLEKLQATELDTQKESRTKSDNKSASLTKKTNANTKKEKRITAFITSDELNKKTLKTTISRIRQIKSKIQNSSSRMEKTDSSRYVFEVQWHKIISNSCACLVMFLIGAPLGAIIKKGGLGIPVLISIFFFIVFYVINMVGEKQAKLGMIDPLVGVWAANIILLPIGLFFLRQARNDARLFDGDFYSVTLDKIKSRFKKKNLTKRE